MVGVLWVVSEFHARACSSAAYFKILPIRSGFRSLALACSLPGSLSHLTANPLIILCAQRPYKYLMRTLREIDIYNLNKELRRTAEDIQYYMKVRNEFIRATQVNPGWDTDELAKMVFKAFEVTEDFMDFYANEHHRAVQDSITARTPPKNNK